LVAPAISDQTPKTCTCQSGSGGCSSSNSMSCCCGGHIDDTHASQICNCLNFVPPNSNIYSYDPGYSGIGENSPRIYGRQSQSATGSNSIQGSRFYNSSIEGANDRPPDLDFVDFLPPSAKHVFDVLASNGPLTQKDLIRKTDLPPRTVRYALSKLKGEEILEERFCFSDARQSIYSLALAGAK
jgi:hypothetical protein